MQLGNPPLAEGIRRLGFRKWYERELLGSHAHMVLAFLSVIAMVAAMEAFRDADASARLTDVACVVLSAAIGLWALRRYLFLLMRAEALAHQAVCPRCGAYARLDLLREEQDGGARVCCRKCANQWTMLP